MVRERDVKGLYKERKKDRLFIFPTTAHLNVYNIRLNIIWY